MRPARDRLSFSGCSRVSALPRLQEDSWVHGFRPARGADKIDRAPVDRRSDPVTFTSPERERGCSLQHAARVRSFPGVRRSILIGVTAGLAVLILASLGTAAYVVHRRDKSRAERLTASVKDAEHEEASVRAKLAAAAKSEKAAVKAAYTRGLRAGTKAAQQAQSAAGDTYNSGYDDGVNAGYAATLGSFDYWNDGGWYLVKMSSTGDPSTPYQVETRSPMRFCLWTYITNDQIYTGNLAC